MCGVGITHTACLYAREKYSWFTTLCTYISLRILSLYIPHSINGIPACANNELLTTILRDEWGFQGEVFVTFHASVNPVIVCYVLPHLTGYVVSDQGAIGEPLSKDLTICTLQTVPYI